MALSLNLLSTRGGLAAAALLLMLLLFATLTDLQRRRIPNWLTVPGLLAGLLLHGIVGGLDGFVSSLGGALLWFVVGFSFYSKVGGIGAGDIKLVIAAAALTGAIPTLYLAVFSLGLQVLWLFGRWLLSGHAGQNFRNLFVWIQVTFVRGGPKIHFVPAGLPDKSPHAPFMLLAALLLGSLVHLHLLQF